MKSDLTVKQKTAARKRAPCSCDVCGKTFHGRSVLQIHLRTHSGEKPFECKSCGKTFRQVSHLTSHMNIACTEKSGENTTNNPKTFPCDKCGKVFMYSHVLKQHLRTHSGERPYVCDICGKGFRQLSHLTGHRKVVCGDSQSGRTFECSFCKRRFSYKEGLDNHTRIHTGEKPYVCAVCGRMFRQSGNLKIHMKGVHNNKRVTVESRVLCNTCGKIFRSERAFNQHAKIHDKQKMKSKRNKNIEEKLKTEKLNLSSMSEIIILSTTEGDIVKSEPVTDNSGLNFVIQKDDECKIQPKKNKNGQSSGKRNPSQVSEFVILSSSGELSINSEPVPDNSGLNFVNQKDDECKIHPKKKNEQHIGKQIPSHMSEFVILPRSGDTGELSFKSKPTPKNNVLNVVIQKNDEYKIQPKKNKNGQRTGKQNPSQVSEFVIFSSSEDTGEFVIKSEPSPDNSVLNIVIEKENEIQMQHGSNSSEEAKPECVKRSLPSVPEFVILSNSENSDELVIKSNPVTGTGVLNFVIHKEELDKLVALRRSTDESINNSKPNDLLDFAILSEEDETSLESRNRTDSKVSEVSLIQSLIIGKDLQNSCVDKFGRSVVPSLLPSQEDKIVESPDTYIVIVDSDITASEVNEVVIATEDNDAGKPYVTAACLQESLPMCVPSEKENLNITFGVLKNDIYNAATDSCPKPTERSHKTIVDIKNVSTLVGSKGVDTSVTELLKKYRLGSATNESVCASENVSSSSRTISNNIVHTYSNDELIVTDCAAHCKDVSGEITVETLDEHEISDVIHVICDEAALPSDTEISKKTNVCYVSEDSVTVSPKKYGSLCGETFSSYSERSKKANVCYISDDSVNVSPKKDGSLCGETLSTYSEISKKANVCYISDDSVNVSPKKDGSLCGETLSSYSEMTTQKANVCYGTRDDLSLSLKKDSSSLSEIAAKEMNVGYRNEDTVDLPLKKEYSLNSEITSKKVNINDRNEDVLNISSDKHSFSSYCDNQQDGHVLTTYCYHSNVATLQQASCDFPTTSRDTKAKSRGLDTHQASHDFTTSSDTKPKSRGLDTNQSPPVSLTTSSDINTKSHGLDMLADAAEANTDHAEASVVLIYIKKEEDISNNSETEQKQKQASVVTDPIKKEEHVLVDASETELHQAPVKLVYIKKEEDVLANHSETEQEEASIVMVSDNKEEHILVNASKNEPQQASVKLVYIKKEEDMLETNSETEQKQPSVVVLCDEKENMLGDACNTNQEQTEVLVYIKKENNMLTNNPETEQGETTAVVVCDEKEDTVGNKFKTEREQAPAKLVYIKKEEDMLANIAQKKQERTSAVIVYGNKGKDMLIDDSKTENEQSHVNFVYIKNEEDVLDYNADSKRKQTSVRIVCAEKAESKQKQTSVRIVCAEKAESKQKQTSVRIVCAEKAESKQKQTSMRIVCAEKERMFIDASKTVQEYTTNTTDNEILLHKIAKQRDLLAAKSIENELKLKHNGVDVDGLSLHCSRSEHNSVSKESGHDVQVTTAKENKVENSAQKDQDTEWIKVTVPSTNCNKVNNASNFKSLSCTNRNAVFDINTASNLPNKNVNVISESLMSTKLNFSKTLKRRSAVSKKHKCLVCSKMFQTRANLKHHSLIHEGLKPFQCNLCGKFFRQKCHLVEHGIHHRGIRNVICEICGKTFIHKKSLITHQRIHTDTRLFACSICQKTFRQSSHLATHGLTHSKHKHHQCDICDKSFSTKYALKNHNLTHSDIRLFSCSRCGRSFRQSSALKTHELTHNPVRSFKCDACDRLFSHAHVLKRHQLTHNKIRPFKCESCDKSFTQSGHLKIHQQTYENKKLFECRVCSRRFNTNAAVKTHLVTHEKEKPFKCSTCSSTFCSQGSLKLHEQKHVQSYSCALCGKMFTTVYVLNKHTCKRLK